MRFGRVVLAGVGGAARKGFQPLFRKDRQLGAVTEHSRLSKVLLAAAFCLLAAGCGSPPGPAAGGRSAGEANTGEAASVPYTDARFHYRIDAPGGRMQPSADGSAVFIGPQERLEVRVVGGRPAADPLALAHSDLLGLQGSQDFRLLSAPREVTLGGNRVVKLVYEWTAGTSQVTGKPIHLTGVRYYVPKNASELAVITYGITASQYDPQGADDLESTFRWL